MSGRRKAGEGYQKKRGKRAATPRGEVPLRLRCVLGAYPVRNEQWLAWEADAKGLVTVTHQKDLHRWERWLMKKVGGSPVIHRKLDEPGSIIWRLCDGEHTVADICSVMDQKYKEDMEPVLTRVIRFLEMLLERNLISLERSLAATDRASCEKGKRARKGGDGA